MLRSLDSLFDSHTIPFRVRGGVLEAKKGPKGPRPALDKAVVSTPAPPAPPSPTPTHRQEKDVDAAKRAAKRSVDAAAAQQNQIKTAAQKRVDTIARKRKVLVRDALRKNKETRRERVKQQKVQPDSGTPQKGGQINAQLAHCILALHFKRSKDVRASWNICRWSLTRFGYLKGPYREAGKVKDLKVTQKGSRRAMQHSFEKSPLNGGIQGDPAAKYAKFQNLFKSIEPTV